MIIITKLAQPEVGAVMAQYCAVCKNTTFTLHPFAAKPEDGDYWLLTMPCHRHLWPKKFSCELQSTLLSWDPTHQEKRTFGLNNKLIKEEEL